MFEFSESIVDHTMSMMESYNGWSGLDAPINSDILTVTILNREVIIIPQQMKF